jgi:capsular polysaccharide biosynthesis protein
MTLQSPAVSNLSHIDAYVAAHPKKIWCIRVAPEEISLAPAPRFLFGPMTDHLTRSMFGSLRCNPVGCYGIHNGRLGFDGLAQHETTALWSIALNHPQEHVRSAIMRNTADGGPWPLRHIPGQAACLHGPGYNVYGHWLVDFLPKLFILQASGYDIFKLRYILPLDCPAVGLDFMRLIGISARQLVPYDPACEHVQIDELLMPTNLRTGNRLHPIFAQATRAWADRILPENVQPPAARRLFVSRSGVASGRVLGNREAVESLAVSAGFELVHPQDHSLPDQIALFRSARQVIGEYGSGLHATIYGQPSLHCCALRGTPHWHGFIQSSLGAAFGQSMSYVFGDAGINDISYTFDVYLEDFRRALDCLELELREK